MLESVSRNRKIRTFFLSLFVAVVGSAIGWYGHLYYARYQPSEIVEYRENSPQYKYINPLLFIDRRESVQYDKLKKIVSAAVTNTLKNKNIYNVSIYFNDLNTGKWIGVNENDLYTPSSMLKVVVMMDYLKQAENDPSILTKTLYYKPADDPGQYYKPLTNPAAGYYSVNDLISRMIVDSDNTAAEILLENDKDGFNTTYQVFRLPSTDLTNFTDYLSPKSYSVLFRSLYNASYFSRDISEQSLELLAHTTFTKGLVAGVPEGTVVAHKFGEHTYIATDGTQAHELHDCGIIYTPQKPYFLCIMTKGADFPSLESAIASLSKVIYQNN